MINLLSVEGCRYSDELISLLEDFGIVKVLFCEYEANYQGYVDVDVLLVNGKIFSYKYYYGSCSVCDEWEATRLSFDEIKEVMKQEATYFDNLIQYRDWLKALKVERAVDLTGIYSFNMLNEEDFLVN